MNKITLGKPESTMEDRAWISVNETFDICIIKTDEGIVIDVYPFNDSKWEPIATTYAYDAEAKEDE